jgi:hypothetical protein
MTTLQNISYLPNTSRDDSNNSGIYNRLNLLPKFSINGIFTGISTNTNGFNSVIVNISSDTISKSCGLLIQFSDTGTDFDSNGIINYSTVYYSDTVLNSNYSEQNEIIESSFFIKSYPILKKYYRISYTPAIQPNILIISSRLSTENYNNNVNSVNTFTDKEENTLDALGRLRVSYPKTLIDINFPSGMTGSTGYNANYLNVCQGYSGNSGYTGLSYGNSHLTLSITGQINEVSQSRKYSVYQPGKALLFIGSGKIQYNNNSISGPYGYINKIGYFDNYNGFHFGFDGNMFILIKSLGDTSIFYQCEWNIDKMDGTGPNGITLDFTKMQIFVIDMEWSNTGRIRFGFYLLGKIIYCHRINRLNNDINIPLNLPIRYEIVGLAGCTGTVSLTQMSATVISEGGYNPTGNLFSFTWISPSSISTSEKPLFALKGGGNNYYHQNIIPTKLSLGSSNNTDIFIYKMRLYLNPNEAPISNLAVWNSPDNFSNYGALSVTQGTTGVTGPTNWNDSIILDTAVICGSKIIKYDNKNTNMEITADVNNISSIIVITVENATNNIYGTITWKEIY